MPTKKANKKRGKSPKKSRSKKGATEKTAARKKRTTTTSSSARKSRNGGKASKATRSAGNGKGRGKKPKTAEAAGGGKSAKAASNGAKDEKVSRGPVAAKDKRQLVQERKILRSQSRWLQKALFALAKAEDDHAKLADVRGDAHEPMAVVIDGTTHEVGDVTDSLRDSVMERLEGLRVTLRNEHALMG